MYWQLFTLESRPRNGAAFLLFTHSTRKNVKIRLEDDYLVKVQELVGRPFTKLSFTQSDVPVSCNKSDISDQTKLGLLSLAVV